MVSTGWRCYAGRFNPESEYETHPATGVTELGYELKEAKAEKDRALVDDLETPNKPPTEPISPALPRNGRLTAGISTPLSLKPSARKSSQQRICRDAFSRRSMKKRHLI